MSSSEQDIALNNTDILNNEIKEEKEGIDNTKQNAIIRAFLANIGIALVKLVCFAFSKSSAMLAEAIHSGVDSFNSICLCW